MRRAYVETRRQKAPGSWPRQGPDTYVAVQIVPEGVEPLNTLRQDVAAKRGIEIVYCGEGYSNRCKTDRSMLGAALKRAEELAAEINRGEKTNES